MFGRRVARVVALGFTAVIVAMPASGCASQSGSPEDAFTRGRFARFDEAENVPVERVREIAIVQVAWDKNDADTREDLGFMITSDVLVPLRPWRIDPDEEFYTRGPNSFRAPVTDADGNRVDYECVYHTELRFSDLAGNPVGRISADGEVQVMDAESNKFVRAGAGTPAEAARRIWNIPVAKRKWNRETQRQDVTEPQVFLTIADARTLRDRQAAAAARSQDPAVQPDPLYHDRDRVWNR